MVRCYLVRMRITMTSAESARHVIIKIFSKKRNQNGLNKLFRDPGGAAPVEGGDQASG